MKKYFTLFFMVLICTVAPAQSIGGYLGGGIINANSPNITAATGSFFIESGSLISSNLSARLSFLYSIDINKVLPSNTTRYGSYLKGITLKAVTSQPFGNTFYIEEAVGLAAINERIFSDVNEIDLGAVIAIAAGIDFRKFDEPSGFRLAAGTDYSFTFTNSYAQYFSIYLQGQYFF